MVHVRIIDYKTGSIDLKYSMLYNGLNFVMFVYLNTYLKPKSSEYRRWIEDRLARMYHDARNVLQNIRILQPTLT